MKKQILMLVATFGFIITLSSLSVNAQVHGRLVANIPFDFYAGDQKVSAGKYTIESANPRSDGATLILRRENGKGTKILNLMPVAVNSEAANIVATMIFNRYGNEYFLSEISNPRQNFGARATRSKIESDTAKRFGSSTPKIVALNPIGR